MTLTTDVIDTIHPNDEMLGPGAEETYFRLGRQAVECVQSALGCAGLSFPVRTDSILDLPSGYGRVLRFLRVAYPDAAITASDIVREGVDFCVETFGARGLYSAHDPRDIDTGTYDLIWCGSLLTHMPAEMWDPWLGFFEDHLNPNGSVVFTTHGDAYAKGFFPWHMPANLSELRDEYEDAGFAFSANPWERDQDAGIAFSSPEWVLERLRKLPSLRVTAFMERGWHDAHDAWCATKVPNERADADRQRVGMHIDRPADASS